MPGNSEDLVGVSLSLPHPHFPSGISVTGLSPGPPPTLGSLTHPFWVLDDFSDAVSPYSGVVSDSLFLGQNQTNPPCPGPTAGGLQVLLFPWPPPGDHPSLGIEPRSPAMQADSFPIWALGEALSHLISPLIFCVTARQLLMLFSFSPHFLASVLGSRVPCVWSAHLAPVFKSVPFLSISNAAFSLLSMCLHLGPIFLFI